MEKIKNRIFAFFFFVVILLWVLWQPVWTNVIGKDANLPPYPYSNYIHPFNAAFLIVLAGLLYEVYRPTLNFKFDKNWKWISIGIFLFAIAITVIFVDMIWKPYESNYSVLGSRTFEFPRGSGHFYTWSNLLWGFLTTISMETTSFSLLFGFLFMTKSTPQVSKSYKIMLIGVAAFEVIVFLMNYVTFFVSEIGVSIYAGLTRMELLTAYWFHWDFWSELVILISAIWLLKKGKKFL